MTEANYTKPASQVDLEERNSEGYVPPSQLQTGTDGEPSKNGYIALDPIYQNYSNSTEAPHRAEDSVEQDLIDENFLADEVDYESAAVPEGQTTAAEEEKDEEPTKPSGPNVPPSTAPSGGN
jgi:hypothetical protein